MAQVGLSKSKYTKGVQCPKMLWMERHMPEWFDESVMNQSVLETGNMVGDLAMGYYGDYVEVPFDSSDYPGMVEQTAKLLEAGTPAICEATFSYDGNLCMVDILLVEPDGVRIVEVKSSTSVKDIHYDDMAYQTWLLTQCGLNVKSVSLMHLNRKYVREGDLDLHRLFEAEDCTEQVMRRLSQVELTIPVLRATAQQEDEPDVEIGEQCKKPYECGFRPWCWRNLPKPSVFDLNRIQMKNAVRLMRSGHLTLGEALELNAIRAPRAVVQAKCEAEGLDEIIDRKQISTYLRSFTYPLYFLDFETMMPAIPLFDGTRPYQQIPTQYSLHVLRAPDAELEHYEFLADAHGDPRRAVAEHLVVDIPAGACTIAYNKQFEEGRIEELAKAFPDLADQLRGISENMHDLMDPFARGWYYVSTMGGSNSIKVVLPALFPDDPELDYHALEGVQNGAEAMEAFAAMEKMDPEEEAQMREQLLRYCELDTYAMVKIWERLCEVAE